MAQRGYQANRIRLISIWTGTNSIVGGLNAEVQITVCICDIELFESAYVPVLVSPSRIIKPSRAGGESESINLLFKLPQGSGFVQSSPESHELSIKNRIDPLKDVAITLPWSSSS